MGQKAKGKERSGFQIFQDSTRNEERRDRMVGEVEGNSRKKEGSGKKKWW